MEYATSYPQRSSPSRMIGDRIMKTPLLDVYNGLYGQRLALCARPLHIAEAIPRQGYYSRHHPNRHILQTNKKFHADLHNLPSPKLHNHNKTRATISSNRNTK
ncbi:hypothetical protein M758_3G249200 [Ceratodon purpureus]|uniref:Uncharacterized protein n=1 Tax=Ceratodon purpureus TaxID=3225 RepID=A0A8T0IQU3_CERPU|nr:hypothetical protein KC19_3G248800 [Ceratodon purpureus]KAG0624454.1 hypothetical protein M758_3G249200 [Ceratodon purpureus]